MRKIWTNARVLSKQGPAQLEIATHDEQIAAIGADLPREGAEVVDCGGRLLTAAPIDCHTHLIHGGDRAREFELRLEGASYEQIAREGGGIASTMAATRSMSVDALVETALPRLDHLLAEGVCTVEIKSGYGLTVESELDMLRAARKLAKLRPVRIVTSWLAAHALPPEYSGDRAGYISEVAIAGLEKAHAEGLADAVDGFCEGIAFSAEELAPLFDRAQALGLPVKLHAEQLSHSRGVQLAVRYGALSADHVEYADAEDALAMAEAGSVAVLLPGAYYMLRETRSPPVQTFRDAGVPMALATDANPGSSPLFSILLAMNMGATLFRMTVPECVEAVTGHAARALGLADRTGALRPGLSADFALWDVESPAQLINRIGFNPLHARVFQGNIV